MLAQHLVPRVKLIGLAGLVNSGRPGFDGLYRVVPVGGTIAIEFFDAATRKTTGRDEPVAMHKIRILPYRTSMINEMPLGGQEVISGPFTGCVMSLYDRKGVRMAGHVDTNPDTTQRKAYDTLKTGGDVALVEEYDTTGKIDPNAGASQVIFCVAQSGGIDRYLVRPEAMTVSVMQKANPLQGRDKDQWELGAQTAYTVLSKL